MKLREAFANLSKKTAPSATVRGSAFTVDFAGESEEDNSIAAEGPKGKREQLISQPKRAGTSVKRRRP